jgi:hypothetical protein
MHVGGTAVVLQLCSHTFYGGGIPATGSVALLLLVALSDSTILTGSELAAL